MLACRHLSCVPLGFLDRLNLKAGQLVAALIEELWPAVVP